MPQGGHLVYTPAMLDVTESQVAAFRALRSHIAGTGAPDPTSAARDVLGAQAQVLAPALHALALRTAGPTPVRHRPTLEEIRAELHTGRRLVHTWGQRDTLHLYDPEDWPYFAASWQVWSRTGRRGLEPPEKAVRRVHKKLQKGEPLTRSDVSGFLAKAYIDEWEERTGSRDDAIRFGAGRLFWSLAHAGEVCLGTTRGREQTYVARRTWLPELSWPSIDPGQAATELTRRYLHVHGPATPHDLAHFFGAKVSVAKGWLDSLPDLVQIRCGGRDGLLLHESDVDPLRARRSAPRARFLPKFDTLLMAHADKSWTVPDEGERKQVWLRFADVAAVVLARGRVVATWKPRGTKKRLGISVTPLSQWTPDLRAEIEADAQDTARILGSDTVELSV